MSGAETVTRYVWGLDLSQSVQGAGGIGGLLMQEKDDATGQTKTRLYTYEANGNVGQLVDGTTGEVVAHYEYDPFGTTLTASGTAAEANPFRFSTKYTDADTDLLYYGYRFYSPYLGRWLTRDPIEEEGGWNLYGFVGNDGVNGFDYLGMDNISGVGQWIRELRENPPVLFTTLSGHALHNTLMLYKDHEHEVGREIASQYPDKVVTDCITYSLNVLKYAYNMMGEEDIAKKLGRLGGFGMNVASYLRTLGWKAIYWNQDINHPSDADDEHVAAWKEYQKSETY